MAQTVAGMVAAGFEEELEVFTKERGDVLVYTARRWTLGKGPQVELELEVIEYPDGREAFYLALNRYHGLSSFSFPLDSWKLWPDRVEFKFYADPESGQGLTFELDLQA